MIDGPEVSDLVADHGAIGLPGEQAIPWARCVVTDAELEPRRRVVGERQVCVLVPHREHGQQLLTEYLVPNAWLDAFLFELTDSPGDGTEIIGVEWVA